MALPSLESSIEHQRRQSATSAAPPWRRYVWLGGVGLILIVAALIWAMQAMFSAPGQTQVLRDIAIVFVALEALVIGLALVILIVQLALLMNMLKNEIQPILLQADETMRTVRGTTVFLSDQVVKPVAEVHGMVAAVREAVHLLFSWGHR